MIEIVHRRRARRAELRRRSEAQTRAAGLGLGYVFSILLAIGIFAFAFAYADLTRGLPSIEQLPILLNPTNGLLLQPTRLYDRTGEHLIHTFAPDDTPRVYIPLRRLPESLVNATVAAADVRFNDHPGYLLAGLDNPDAHPTLAQELAYDLLLFNEPPSLRRALRERLLAAQITARYGRDQVMEWYLNSANYGNYAFGADAAARLYFDKPASELTLAESAMLASVSQAPSLNPLDAPEAAAQRAREILKLMKTLGMISEEESTLPSPVIGTVEDRAGGEGGSAFVNLVMSQLSTRYDRQRIERGGLVIVTTLDYELQQNATCLTRLYVARLSSSSAIEGDCPAARYLPALPPETNLADPSASALVLDPRSGQILALVGETVHGEETPLLAAHPAGTLLTPFVYLTGFTRGLGPASLVWDIPNGDLQNPDGKFHGPMRLRAALANDYLIPAVDVIEQMGEQNAVNTARSFGLEPSASLRPGLAPGAAFVSDSAPQSLLDLAAAYAVFAAQGLRNGQSFDESIRPSAVLRLETTDGATWLDWSQPESQSVVSPQLAYLMNHALSDGPARWPSWGNPNVLEIGRPAAVKPGWTGGPDAWTVGYTPARLVAVWSGSTSISPPPVGEGPGVRAVATLWSALMQTAAASLPPDGWTMPAGVTEMDVCDPSGLLPTDDCPAVVREVFLNSFEPHQADDLFHAYAVNRETGLLATVFTPPELVENRVFMVVPEEARAWAVSAGIPVPPEAYDAIQPGVANLNVNITSPALFAEVGGRVQIVGAAAGEGFQYYRIQIGQGLNPRAWKQIGGDMTTPVTSGPLLEWDATGLSGLYAVQLIVVYEDQRVETAVTLVNVGAPPTLAP